MSITIHCERCKKKIKAPDDAGGKYGNCPHCKHRCYVPLPHDDNEPELKLAPIDDEEERRYNQMMRETYNASQNILHETQGPDGPDEPPAGPMDEKELIRNIVMYLRMMADGELDQADRIATQIKRRGPEA